MNNNSVNNPINAETKEIYQDRYNDFLNRFFGTYKKLIQSKKFWKQYFAWYTDLRLRKMNWIVYFIKENNVYITNFPIPVSFFRNNIRTLCGQLEYYLIDPKSSTISRIFNIPESLGLRVGCYLFWQLFSWTMRLWRCSSKVKIFIESKWSKCKLRNEIIFVFEFWIRAIGIFVWISFSVSKVYCQVS